MCSCIEVVEMYDTEVDSANGTACVAGSLAQAPHASLWCASRPRIWYPCYAWRSALRSRLPGMDS